MVRRSVVAAALSALLLALAGCTPTSTSGPRPVTSNEAQVLAVVRFKNFDAGTRAVTTTLRDAGSSLGLSGWVDYSTAVGYALLTDSGKPADLLLWSDTTLAAQQFTSATTAPLPPPDASAGLGDTWKSAALNSPGTLHSLLAILIGLGNDRPDNPLLLRQGGALWLRTDTVNGTPVTVFAGPTASGSTATPRATVDPDASSTHYWVDKSGLLLRFEVRLGVDWVTVNFAPATEVHIADPFAAG